MPKKLETLKKELHAAETILEHHEYHSRVKDMRKLPSKSELETRIAKLKAAIAKKSGGTRRHRRARHTRSTRRR
jgi:DNA polymerase/3'-5' exonuclease PolX